MPYLNVPPPQAKELLDQGDGWIYVDVRTEAEFAAGHPAGAYNLPLALGTPPNMVVNPEFLAVLKASFKKTSKLLFGCASGGRSSRACELAANAGFLALANMSGGFMGARTPLGVVEKGWAACGLPVEKECARDHSYEALRRNV
jgi:rhodanese-related sulfurtransferase